MLRRWRLKKAHAKFLESCRNLKEGRAYWSQASGFRKWFLEAITPIPALGLHEDGQRLLEALQWLEAHCRTSALREDALREYHRLVMGKERRDSGDYRSAAITVTGSSIQRPPGSKVAALMKQLDLKLQGEQERLDALGRPETADVLAFAVAVHQRIAFIHPFPDANGRVARLAMNHILRRYGRGYAIFPPVNESRQHWDALEEAHRGNLEPLIRFAEATAVRV